MSHPIICNKRYEILDKNKNLWYNENIGKYFYYKDLIKRNNKYYLLKKTGKKVKKK